MDNSEEKILVAAEEIFISKGFDGARMQHIADEAGTNKALLHYYFLSKEKLFDKVIKRKINSFLPHATQIFKEDIPLIQKLEYFVDDYLAMLYKNKKLPYFILNTINKYPNIAKLLPHGFIEDIKMIFAKEAKKGNIKNVDPSHLIVSIISMCVFPLIGQPVVQHVLDLESEEYKTFLEERGIVIKSYLNYILKPD